MIPLGVIGGHFPPSPPLRTGSLEKDTTRSDSRASATRYALRNAAGDNRGMSSPTRTLTLHLAPFEHDALERYGAVQGVPPDRAVRTAILYYLREEESNRPTWPLPPGRG